MGGCKPASIVHLSFLYHAENKKKHLGALSRVVFLLYKCHTQIVDTKKAAGLKGSAANQKK